MKTSLVILVGLALAIQAQATTTINIVNRYAYGANLGWLDWCGDTANGAAIGEYVCSGYIYAANVGWINLGGNSPANLIQYQNNSASDYGVNHDGVGNLRGYAYGANIGWVNFASQGVPKIDLKTGKLSGYIYSANCGWISLNNAIAFVQTDIIQPGADTDGDGIADAWEYPRVGNLTLLTHNGDVDSDGISDYHEYLVDTDALDSNSNLRITAFTAVSTLGGISQSITWTSRPTRCYKLQVGLSLSPATTWFDSVTLSPDAGTTTTRYFAWPPPDPPQQSYYRIIGFKPLSP